MGKPGAGDRVTVSVGARGETRGTETSKYPEEEKSSENPQVAASERGRAQTHCVSRRQPLRRAGCGARVGGLPSPRAEPMPSRGELEGSTTEGNSPVGEGMG